VVNRHDGGVTRVLLVLPSSTYRATEFLAAAARLGIDVVTGSDAPQAMAGALPGRFVVLPLDDPPAAADAVEAFDSVTPVDAVVAVDDAGALAAAAAAERLGLAKNPSAAIAATRDKAVMRRLLGAAGVAQPRFEIVAASSDEHDALATASARLGYPVVVKPCSLAASRGVIRADDERDAQRVAATVRRIAVGAGRPASEPLLVESFVPGDEVALEGLLTDGRLEVLAVFDKPDPLDGPFFEETIYLTPSRHPAALQRALAAAVTSACAALGLVDGPVHAEARLTPRGADPEARVVVLEAAARTIGGKCSKALRFSSGRSLEEIVLARAVGADLDLADARLPDASGVMMLPVPSSGRFGGIDGTDAALRVPGVWGLEVTVPVGGHLTAWPAGDRYLGFLFARAARPDQVEEALRRGFAALDVRVNAEVATGAGG
jgi:biotin carboxylase